MAEPSGYQKRSRFHRNTRYNLQGGAWAEDRRYQDALLSLPFDVQKLPVLLLFHRILIIIRGEPYRVPARPPLDTPDGGKKQTVPVPYRSLIVVDKRVPDPQKMAESEGIVLLAQLHWN